MTTQEFNIQFDVLWNNIMSNQAPGLNIYEKSVFLTKAQDELIKNYFNPKGNKYGEGIDGSRKRETDFSMLIVTVSPSKVTEDTFVRLNPRSFCFALPDDVLAVLNESCTCSNDSISKELAVVPVSYQEYQRLMSKAYKAPYKEQCWRIFTQASTTPRVEIIAGYQYTDCKYTVRYVRIPPPIIVGNLGELTIGGQSTVSECILSEEIHQEILQRAVELAKVAWSPDSSAVLTTGNRSE